MSENEKWNLPERLRVDLDTEASRAMLEEANAQQVELAEAFGGPFQYATPNAKLRARAGILVNEGTQIGVDKMTPEQREEFADALAVCGFYAFAAAATQDQDKLDAYKRISSAILQDDGFDCGHGTKNKTAEAEIYSIKHGQDVVLLRCTVCQDVNAVPVPKWLKDQRSRRQQIRSKYTGMKPLDAREAMLADGVIT